MSLIFLCLTTLLLVLNLAGVGMLLRPWLPHYLLAKVIGVLGFCLGMFFIEHFLGLGRLSGLWPFTSVAAAIVLYRSRHEWKSGLWRQEAVFLLFFAAALFWKFSFPNIDGHSEQLTDLSFITSYMSGVRLPPPDYWLPDHRLDFYYSFQAYAAALLGRILGLTPGYAMNMATAVLLSLLASLVWFVAGRFSTPRWARALLVYAIMLGGTGVAPFTHFIYDQSGPVTNPAFTATSNMWANVRFAGMYDVQVNDSWLARTFVAKPESNTPARDLPLETLGYLTLQGEYHAPQGGILFLFLTLACLVLLELPGRKPADGIDSAPYESRTLQALLASTVPLTLITNTWVFPLQAFLVLAWIIYRYGQRRPPDWLALIAGGGAALLLSYPFLSHFALQALSTPIRWVAPIDHTPLNRFLMIQWPALTLMALAALRLRRQPYTLLLLPSFACLLLLSEFFYADDPLADQLARFNSTLKWWSWIYPGVLLGLGSILLGAGRWYRWSAVLVLLLISTFSLDLASYWYYSDKNAMGKLSGHSWLTQDSVDKQILEWLTVAPPGIVLEGLGTDVAYTPSSALALFAGKPAAIGWPNHESQWRGNPVFITTNAEQARSFYHGSLPDPQKWLDTNRVRYIVWSQRDQQRDPLARASIQEQIGAAYEWIPFSNNGVEQLGIWVWKG